MQTLALDEGQTVAVDDGQALARRLSTLVLSVPVLLCFGIQWGMSYTLGAGPPGFPLRDYGSYGAFLATVPPRTPGHRTVVLLGNSVYQYYDIPACLQTLADRDGKGLTFLNYSQTGSTIFDYLVRVARVLSCKPDLLVVSFINNAFTDWRADGGVQPRFRTDADQMLFDWPVLSRLPFSFYSREFTMDELCTSLVSTLLPFRRLDPIPRGKVAAVLRRKDLFPAWVNQLVPIPGLNLAGEWNQAHPAVTGGREPQAYPQARDLLQELAQMARAAHVPVLLLRQQAGDWDAKPDVLPLLQAAVKECSLLCLKDLHQAQENELGQDGVHPDLARRKEYALRHYRAITSVVDGLGR